MVPWIFIHGTDIADRSFLLFFGLFSVAPLPGRGVIVLFSGLFCYFVFFFRCPLPPGIFSADALVSGSDNERIKS